MKSQFTATVTIIMVASIVTVIIISWFIAFNAGVEMNVNDIDIAVTWSAFNTSIAVLEVYIVIFTLGLAVLGVVGYNNIKKQAVAIAQSTIDATIDASLKGHVKELKSTLFTELWNLIEDKIDQKIDTYDPEMISRIRDMLQKSTGPTGAEDGE